MSTGGNAEPACDELIDILEPVWGPANLLERQNHPLIRASQQLGSAGQWKHDTAVSEPHDRCNTIH